MQETQTGECSTPEVPRAKGCREQFGECSSPEVPRAEGSCEQFGECPSPEVPRAEGSREQFVPACPPLLGRFDELVQLGQLGQLGGQTAPEGMVGTHGKRGAAECTPPHAAAISTESGVDVVVRGLQNHDKSPREGHASGVV